LDHRRWWYSRTPSIPPVPQMKRMGEKEGQEGAASVVATGAAEDPLVVAAVRNAPAILGSVYRSLPPPEELRALLAVGYLRQKGSISMSISNKLPVESARNAK
jgi:hypothetical protein